MITVRATLLDVMVSLMLVTVTGSRIVAGRSDAALQSRHLLGLRRIRSDPHARHRSRLMAGILAETSDGLQRQEDPALH